MGEHVEASVVEPFGKLLPEGNDRFGGPFNNVVDHILFEAHSLVHLPLIVWEYFQEAFVDFKHSHEISYLDLYTVLILHRYRYLGS